MPRVLSLVSVLVLIPLFLGCETIYGWKIHAPGMLSEEYFSDLRTVDARVGLYIPEGLSETISKNKGTWYSDPQTYYIGESFVPMLVEAFQHGFEEFILFEIPPTPTLMEIYDVEQLAVVEIMDFGNRKTLKGQGLDLMTETTVYDQSLKLIYKFQTRGTSEALGVFAKKGGLEVNLNAAIEGALRSTVESILDRV